MILFPPALLATKAPTPVKVSIAHTKTLETKNVVAIAPCPVGDKIAVSFDDGSIGVYNAATGGLLSTFKKHPQPAYGLTWSADGRYVASGDETARIFVWNPYNHIVVNQFRKNLRGIQALSFDKSRELLLCTSKDDVITIYNLKTTKVQETLPGKGVNFFSAHFSPDSRYFTAATLNSTSRIFSPKGVTVRSFDIAGGQGAMDAEYSPDGKMVVFAAKNGTAQIFDVHSGKRYGTLTGDTDWVTTAVFSPNGKVVATASVDRTVKLWDVKTLKPILTLESQSGLGSPLAFTSDGKYLITANAGSQLQITTLSPALGSGSESSASKPVKRSRRRR